MGLIFKGEHGETILFHARDQLGQVIGENLNRGMRVRHHRQLNDVLGRAQSQPGDVPQIAHRRN